MFERILNKPYELPYISLCWKFTWFSYKSYWHMKVYICDQLASSVNDVECSNAVVSEFMNEVDDITDITIFDFTVPWVFSFEIYLILLCLESLVLKHHRLPYPCRVIWQEKFWRYLFPFIGTNLQVSIFCLGFLVTKFWPNLICLGKQGKMGKQKQPSKRKKYALQSW